MTHIYIKPSSNQRSPTSREASAAGRLRPNSVIVDVKSIRNHFSANATYRDLPGVSPLEQCSSHRGAEGLLELATSKSKCQRCAASAAA